MLRRCSSVDKRPECGHDVEVVMTRISVLLMTMTLQLLFFLDANSVKCIAIDVTIGLIRYQKDHDYHYIGV